MAFHNIKFILAVDVILSGGRQNDSYLIEISISLLNCLDLVLIIIGLLAKLILIVSFRWFRFR